MSQLSRSAITTDVNNNIYNNTSRDISGLDVADRMINIIDSFISREGDNNITDVLTYSAEHTISDNKDLTHKKYVDDLIASVLSGDFTDGGDTFGANAELGTNDAFSLLFRTNNTNRGGIDSSGKFMFGLTTPLTDTHKSNKSHGNTNATLAEQWTASDNSVLAKLWNDGLFSAFGGLSTDGIASIFSDTVNYRVYVGGGAGASASGVRNNFIGGDAGSLNTGDDVNGFGSGAAGSNTNDYVNAFGYQACINNSGTAVNGFGFWAAKNNTGSDVNGFGANAASGNSGSYVNGFGDNCAADNTGSFINAFGRIAAYQNTGSYVNAFGLNAARENTRSNLFTVSEITDIFWNNIGDKGYNTLQAVTMQAAMSANGTDTSAAASIFKIAPARGTGNAASGNIVIQRANVQASGTTRHTLSDGLIFEAQTGYIYASTSTSENALLVGAYQSKSANYTALPTDQTIECTSGTFTVTLYTAVGYKGRTITIINSGGGTITVDGDGSETINGSATQPILTTLSMTIVSNGTNWLII